MHHSMDSDLNVSFKILIIIKRQNMTITLELKQLSSMEETTILG